jgi:hypothetical protein
MQNWIQAHFSTPIQTFFRGLRATKNMHNLLILVNDADSYRANADWNTALQKINEILVKEKAAIQREIDSLAKCKTEALRNMQHGLRADAPRRLRVCIPNRLADTVFPRSILTYTFKYIRVCGGAYSQFFYELFPEIPHELVSKQIRRVA